ncbi:MotA/TolQ/ExbB proton channel family protein [Sediminicola arcticus]|uniref:MotA/TolQ/ExbB proton channel family protein n=1 Tax=Sediminicola arcticus TaxID=1574308 RepID=A0ABV2SPR1_9FLAO
MSEKINISLIECKGVKNETQSDILNSINGYLLRNKGAVSDFMLVKDIVDRNVDKVDDEISNSLPTPLYLGLMGTMIGIVGGLIFMPKMSDSAEQATSGIDALLGGVKIAMIASVVGLLLTIISNYFFFKARKQVEHQKHDFFTFIQTQLLPILSQNTSSSIYSLQTNLLKFNKEFSSNMKDFSGIISTVREAFDSQLQVVQELKRIDITTIAKYNIDVMHQLKSSFKNLTQLSEYLNNMNGFLGNTRELNLAVSQQLKKVGEISEIVKRFDSNAGIISDNSRYLSEQFKNIDSREQAIKNRIVDFDKNTGKMVDNLELSFNKRLQDFNEKDIEISSGFEKLFQDLRIKTREVFDDESSNIKAIKNDVDSLKGVSTELSSLKASVTQQDQTIRDLLEIIRDKPVEIKTSKVVTVGNVILIAFGTITCLSIIYKIFTS